MLDPSSLVEISTEIYAVPAAGAGFSGYFDISHMNMLKPNYTQPSIFASKAGYNP